MVPCTCSIHVSRGYRLSFSNFRIFSEVSNSELSISVVRRRIRPDATSYSLQISCLECTTRKFFNSSLWRNVYFGHQGTFVAENDVTTSIERLRFSIRVPATFFVCLQPFQSIKCFSTVTNGGMPLSAAITVLDRKWRHHLIYWPRFCIDRSLKNFVFSHTV